MISVRSLNGRSQKAAQNPQCGSFLLKRLGLRRILLRRFPYKVIYHLVDGTVEVTSIFAERQHPRVWQRRVGTGQE